MSMLDLLVERIKKKYTIVERDVGAYSHIDKNMMHIDIKAYSIDGVGCLSTLSGKSLLGIIKMETFVFTPLYVDAPLFSYDRMNLLGNDTWIIEIYDMALASGPDYNYSELEEVKAKTFDMPTRDLGAHWYDDIKLPFSVAKKGNKAYEGRIEKHTQEYIDAYLRLFRTLPLCEKEEKQVMIKRYVDGLFANGGPSTDAFVKMLGKDTAYDLFSKYIFSSADE